MDTEKGLLHEVFGFVQQPPITVITSKNFPHAVYFVL